MEPSLVFAHYLAVFMFYERINVLNVKAFCLPAAMVGWRRARCRQVRPECAVEVKGQS